VMHIEPEAVLRLITSSNVVGRALSLDGPRERSDPPQAFRLLSTRAKRQRYRRATKRAEDIPAFHWTCPEFEEALRLRAASLGIKASLRNAARISKPAGRAKIKQHARRFISFLKVGVGRLFWKSRPKKGTRSVRASARVMRASWGRVTPICCRGDRDGREGHSQTWPGRLRGFVSYFKFRLRI
jgi:hypothetical protein